MHGSTETGYLVPGQEGKAPLPLYQRKNENKKRNSLLLGGIAVLLMISGICGYVSFTSGGGHGQVAMMNLEVDDVAENMDAETVSQKMEKEMDDEENGDEVDAAYKQPALSATDKEFHKKTIAEIQKEMVNASSLVSYKKLRSRKAVDTQRPLIINDLNKLYKKILTHARWLSSKKQYRESRYLYHMAHIVRTQAWLLKYNEYTRATRQMTGISKSATSHLYHLKRKQYSGYRKIRLYLTTVYHQLHRMKYAFKRAEYIEKITNAERKSRYELYLRLSLSRMSTRIYTMRHLARYD